jgi:hypothetical protein
MGSPFVLPQSGRTPGANLRAGETSEGPDSRLATRPARAAPPGTDDHGDAKRHRGLRHRELNHHAVDPADCAALSILFRMSSQTDLTSAVITVACWMRSKISFASSRYFCAVSWT